MNTRTEVFERLLPRAGNKAILPIKSKEGAEMRKIELEKAREILRQHFELGLSQREIAKSANVSLGTVSGIIARARSAGLKCPLPKSNKELGSYLYPPQTSGSKKKYAEPDMGYIHKEMQKKGLTLTLLWEEYKSENPDGLMYTQFCERYREFRKQNNVYMHKVYKAGERVMVDWAGLTMPYANEDWEVCKAYIFVGSLPASSYLYAEPFRDMGLRSWIDAHMHMFEYFGGVPAIVTPDCTKTAIIKPDPYDPVENRTYADMARHYGLAVVPARVYRAKDKAPVEKGVQIIERRVIAKLRKSQHLSFAELQGSVRKELDEVNRAPFKKIAGDRKSMFMETERPNLRPLPITRYEYAEWKQAKAGMDYHIEYEKRYYSVLHHYAGKKLQVRATTSTIEIFYEHERIASHKRNYSSKNRYSTLREHMPSNHQAIADWTPERFEAWAMKYGSYTHGYICHLMRNRQHPEQAFKTCAGILRLGESVPLPVMEGICKEALEKNIYTYKYFNMLFKRSTSNEPQSAPAPVIHINLRGKGYYGGEKSV
jgi:transposase